MTEWTAERLDALPDGTVIAWGWSRRIAVKENGLWRDPSARLAYYSEYVIDEDPEYIRVVSVPVTALLSDEACHAAAIVPAIRAKTTPEAFERRRIQAAIDHITGEA